MTKILNKIIIFVFLFSFAATALADTTHEGDFESGSSQYASATDANTHSDLDITGDFSIEFRFDYEQEPGAGAEYTFYDRHDGDNGIWVGINDNDALMVIYEDTTSMTRCITADIFDAGDVGTTKHIAVSVDVDTQNILVYLDGVSKTCTNSHTAASSVGNPANTLYIGTDGAAQKYHDGTLTEFRMWSDIRTEKEIQSHMDCTFGDVSIATSGLIALWKFNNDLLDSHANSTDLTNNNGITFSANILSGCYTAEEEEATSTSQDFSETNLYTSRDLTTIEATTYIYTDSTTTPSELRRTVYHAPQFIVFLFLILFLQIFELFRIEFLIRWRKKQ